MSGAFIAVFGFFVVMMAVIAFFAVRWAVGRDRAVRAVQAGQVRRPGGDVPGAVEIGDRAETALTTDPADTVDSADAATSAEAGPGGPGQPGRAR